MYWQLPYGNATARQAWTVSRPYIIIILMNNLPAAWFNVKLKILWVMR